jgi:hypothetical protein
METTNQMVKTFEGLIDKSSTDGRTFISRFRKLGFRQAMLILCFGILLIALAAASTIEGFSTDDGLKEFLAFTFGLLLFGASLWCIRRAVASRQEISSFLEDLSEIGPEGRTVRELRRRARSLRFNAQISLILIVAALACGLALFVYAPNIASYDRLSQMRFEIELQNERSQAFERERAQQGKSSQLLPDALAALQSRVNALEHDEAQMKTENDPSVKSAQDHQFTQQMVTTSIARFGSIIILLFLVQILVTLYRYNVRAAAFYDGRADALQLPRTSDLTLAGMIEILTPTALDFGKMPSTPLNEVLGAIKGLADKIPLKPIPGS